MIPFLRALWHRARNRGFVLGYAAGLNDGLIETVADHADVALIPDDVISAFWIAHEDLQEWQHSTVALRALYQTLERHLIPEMETSHE